MAPTRACAAPLLSAEEWVDLGDAFSSWVLSADGRSVSKRVVAKHWAAAMAYLNLISEAAEAASHHPDVHLTNWRHVTVTLTTHATGGLTRQDASLAATIDALPLEASPRWLRDAAALEDGAAPDEAAVAFDASHFKEGLNGDFTATAERSADDVLDKFAGGKAGGGGLFENPETRDIAFARDNIVAALAAHAGLAPGTTVADVGAGTGLLVEALSARVGSSGRVLACEPEATFLPLLRDRASSAPHANVTVLEGADTKDPGTPPGAVDVALLVDVYHHLEYPRTILRRLRASLRARGTLAVVDFHKDPARVKSKDPDWVHRHLRADQATFRAEIEACGFTHIAEPFVDGLPENYLMIFRKTPALNRPGDGWGQPTKRPREA